MLPNNEVRLPQPRLASQTIVSRDITEQFTNAASKLRTGQLVKDDFFTLFEAVGALEIMDSKMDSGYLGPGENHAQALEDDYDVMRELQPQEVLGVMDQLLCHEMAWHMGHPLSQTLFTSIYLDKLLWPVPKTLDEARFYRREQQDHVEIEEQSSLTHLVLRAFCLALVKACDLVHARVTAEYYYEVGPNYSISRGTGMSDAVQEEDFVAQLYNRSLLTEFDIEPLQEIINQAVSWLNEQEGRVDVNVKQALVDRLEFRRHFLTALNQDIDVVLTRRKEPFVSCLSLVSPIEKSMSLGTPVPEAFSLKIQRKLASTVPPRPMVTLSSKDAIDQLRRLCQDAIDMQEILDYSCSYDLRVAVWTLVSRKPQPAVYIRSLLQAFIVNDMRVLGSIPVKQFLYDDLTDLVLPCSTLLRPENEEVEMPSDPRFQIFKSMEGFVKRVSQPFVDTFRTACLNRCRVRRALCHTIVDWDNLQVEAEELDTHLRTFTLEQPLMLHGGEPTYSYPLSSWIYHEKLRQIRLIIQMGFELSIYSPEELPGMYWYLSHICSTHLAHIERIRTFVIAESKRNVSATSLLRRGNSKAAERKRAFEKTLAVLDRHTMYLIATEAFALALHGLYAFLDRHQLLPNAASSEAYSCARLRYELRMKPFIPITLPELVPFEVYEREATLKGETDAAVLERATAAVGEARKAWEAVLAQGAFLPSFEPGTSPSTQTLKSAVGDDWQRDIKDTLRACIGASIAIGAVSKEYSAQSKKSQTAKDDKSSSLSLKVEIPEVGSSARWHDWWAVPRISEANAGKT